MRQGYCSCFLFVLQKIRIQQVFLPIIRVMLRYMYQILRLKQPNEVLGIAFVLSKKENKIQKNYITHGKYRS